MNPQFNEIWVAEQNNTESVQRYSDVGGFLYLPDEWFTSTEGDQEDYSWSFICGLPRTGSTVLARMISQHPEIQCQDEEYFPFKILSSLTCNVGFVQGLWNSNAAPLKGVTPANVQKLCRLWHALNSSKPIFMDKGMNYGLNLINRNQELICDIFPKAKFVLTVRNVLDQESSARNQVWASHFEGYDDFDNILYRILHSIVTNKIGQDHDNIFIRFEDMPVSGQDSMNSIFEHLEVNNYPVIIDKDHYNVAIGRWQKDAKSLEFVNWLKNHEPWLWGAIHDDPYTGQSKYERILDRYIEVKSNNWYCNKNIKCYGEKRYE